MTLFNVQPGTAGRPSGGGSAADRVLEDLRGRIISLELPPGTGLLRTELAERYGVSQTPIRDSLQRLEQEGLVQIFPQSRTLVTKIDIPQIHEAHFLRISVEVEIARRLAAKAPSEVLARAHSVLRMQEALRDDSAQTAMFQELDEVFHQTLYQGVGQGNLYLLVRARSNHLNRLRRLDPPDLAKIDYVLRGHHAILDAITAQDPDKAAEAVRAHLSQTVIKLEAQRDRYRDYFS
ncbi:MAG: GntR family transcriptional regulator [Sulfitobacter sp.]